MKKVYIKEFLQVKIIYERKGNMKKICFVTTVFSTYKAFLLDFTKYLHKSGEYEISLICNEQDDIKKFLPSYVKYYPIKMKRGISLSLFTSIKEIYKILKLNQFDIVQYSTPNASFYTAIAGKLARIPTLLYCQWGIRYMGFTGFKRKIFKLIEKITCMLSTNIEAESFNINKFSLDEKLYRSKKSVVIWNGSACGVNMSKFDISMKNEWRKNVRKHLNIEEDDIVYIYAARLTVDKGINELLRAFLEISKEHSNVKLLTLGGIDDKSLLNTPLFCEAKKCSSIIFTGNVDNIEEYYAASDVFVSPSYREGFGLVVIEAGAMGVPAIVTNVPGQIDAIVPGDTGITCELKDVITLKHAMLSFLIQKDLLSDMSKKAYEHVVNNYEQQKLFYYLKQSRDGYIEGGKNA